MKEKMLGKISSASFGLGGYQDAMLGVSFCFEGSGWGVCDYKGFWAPSQIEHSEYCKWTEQDRDHNFAEVMRYVDKLLSEAKVRNFNDLVGKPVEVEFENRTIKSWRLLTEVI